VWSDDAVAFLLLTRTVSHTAAPTLVPVLLERRRPALLLLAVRHVTDLPETSLARVLGYALDPVLALRRTTMASVVGLALTRPPAAGECGRMGLVR
jgi:hypothetical protein